MRPAFLSCGFLALVLSLPVAAASVEDAGTWLQAKDPRAPAAIEALVKSQPGSAAVRILETRLRLQQGRAEDAVDAAEEAVDLAPEDAQAHYWLGNAYGTRIGQVGMLSKAMMAPKIRDAFERAVKLDPGLHDARSSLVSFYLQAPAVAGGDPAKARAQAAELMRRDPPRGHFALGRIATHDKKLGEAAKEFAAAYAARPESMDFRTMAGVAYQQAGQWDAAFGFYEAWTAQDPSAASAWYQIGRTSALSGQRLDQGAAALKRYLSLPVVAGQPALHHAWYRLGQIQAKAGDKAGARVSFGKALAGEPGNKEFKAALAAL